MAGQRAPVRVPRIRLPLGGEVPLRSWAALSGGGNLDERLLRQVLYGISCRNYEAAAEVIPGAIGLSSSSVSRSFIRATAAKRCEFQERDLSDQDIVTMVLDGKTLPRPPWSWL